MQRTLAPAVIPAIRLLHCWNPYTRYSADILDFDKYLERNRCPQNDIICNEEGIWFTQNMLLGLGSDMDYIVSAIAKIHKNADSIKNQ